MEAGEEMPDLRTQALLVVLHGVIHPFLPRRLALPAAFVGLKPQDQRWVMTDPQGPACRLSRRHTHICRQGIAASSAMVRA
jgi:hypothetical protein